MKDGEEVGGPHEIDDLGSREEVSAAYCPDLVFPPSAEKVARCDPVGMEGRRKYMVG